MAEIANSVTSDRFADDSARALEARLFRAMIATVAVAVVASTMLAPWRVTTGLMLGGLLSLLNHHWLQTSIAAVFSVAQSGQRPRLRVARFILRYFVVAAIVFAAYKLQMVSLPAMFAGLCSFVVALFVEAFRQFYFAIINREESF